jgi:hypothetical protein
MAPKAVPTLLLRCGCTVRFREKEAPLCPTHGNQPVARVLAMPKPTFRGACAGPRATTMDLGAFTGQLVGGKQD